MDAMSAMLHDWRGWLQLFGSVVLLLSGGGACWVRNR
jgi:hypothetical protein